MGGSEGRASEAGFRMKIRVLDSALEDLDLGRRFCERLREGLGAYFLGSLRAEVDSLILY